MQNSSMPAATILNTRKILSFQEKQIYGQPIRKSSCTFSKFHFSQRRFFESSIHYVKSDWEKHAHIGPGHMYTYITPIFICDKAEPMAAKLLRKFRRYKSYRFSFWGWSEFHTALIECGENKIITNRSGKCVRKSLGRIIHNS